jgi:hypothetical protein
MQGKKTYDAIISLGGNCAAASQLRMRGLRPVSLPFDWLAMTDPLAIEFLANEFPAGLPGFFKKENIVPFDCPHQNGTAPFHYEDSKSRFCFIHHFHRSLSDGGYEEVRATIGRRLDRMFRLIENGDRILFVLATSFAFDPSLADRLAASFRARWPGKTLDFRFMQFSVSSFDENVLADESFRDDGCGIFRYRRPVGPYDLNLTSYEWSFLDGVVLSSGRKKFSCIDRKLYHVWKRISQRMMNRGYGCAGMRF